MAAGDPPAHPVRGRVARGHTSSLSRSAQFFHQPRRHFFEKARWDAGLGQIGSIAAAVNRAGQNQRVHGARHAHIAKPPLFFDVIRLQKSSRVREQPFFQAAEKYQGELQPLGRVQRHQGNLGSLVVSVGVADQRGMVEKLVQSFTTIAGIHGRVDQFAQVLDARVSLGRVFLLEQFDVAGAVDEKFQNIGRAGEPPPS